MTVFDEIGGKSVSHMAETNHSDTSDSEFGGHDAPRWAGRRQSARQLASRLTRVFDTRACRRAGDECLEIGWTIDTGEASIKDELGYSRGSLNSDLQYVRLRREQHPELQLIRGHLVSHGMRGLDEHCIGYVGRVRSVDRQADSGEGIEVVGRDLPSLGVPRQRNSIAADSLTAKTARCSAPGGRNSLLCVHQGVPLPSSAVASDQSLRLMLRHSRFRSPSAIRSSVDCE
jgi:hypothetical protein